MALDLSALTNPYGQELAGIERNRALATALMQSGSQQPKGEMISGRYVAPSFAQQLNPLLQTATGLYTQNQADKKQTALASDIQQKQAQLLRAFGEAETPAEQFEIASNPYAPDYLKATLPDMLKMHNLGEGATLQRLNMKTGETTVVGKGQEKYHPPIQIDTGTAIEVRDPKDFTKVIARLPKSQMPTAPQIIETANGFVAVNPRNPTQATPVTVDGQQLMGNKANLPEGANKQVTGATNLKDAIVNYKDTLKGFSTLDMANPDARANMGNAYNNMMLQAKEAYNLGVLNGPDYEILQSVVKDPTKTSSLLVSKNALEKQANDLSTQADKIISNVYKTHNRPVPSNLITPSAQNLSDRTPKGGIPSGVTPELWNVMTPQEKAAFK